MNHPRPNEGRKEAGGKGPGGNNPANHGIFVAFQAPFWAVQFIEDIMLG